MKSSHWAISTVALAALLVAMPPLVGSKHLLTFDQAVADKGGNGGGNSGGHGNSGNKGGGKSASAKSSGAKTKTWNASAKPKKKTVSPTTAVAVVSAEDEEEVEVGKKKNVLGRWNAAKPIDHPAIQAHIRNGNFNGTIGRVAAYAVAQDTYDGLEDDIEAAKQVLADAETAAQEIEDATNALNDLVAAKYANIDEYEAAVLSDPGNLDPEIEAAKEKLAGIDAPTQEEVDAASTTIEQGDKALADLADAEAEMAAWSNRGSWDEIRGDVRTKMGLDPDDNDVADAEAAAAAAETDVADTSDTGDDSGDPADEEIIPAN